MYIARTRTRTGTAISKHPQARSGRAEFPTDLVVVIVIGILAAIAMLLALGLERDLQLAERFGIRVLTPKQFLQTVGKIP